MGFQQCLNLGRWWVEGCIPHQPRALRGTSHVLWPHKQPGNFPDDDEWHLLWHDSWRSYLCLPWWYPHLQKDTIGTPENHLESAGTPLRVQLMLQAGGVQVQAHLDRVSLSNHFRGMVEMDLVKVSGVSEWLEPWNKWEVQSFVGFINFYWQFMLQAGILEVNNRLAKSDGSDVGRTWLQLMCCTLPKHLCP